MPTTDLETRLLRIPSNLLALWRLCAKPACRRARQCHGDPRDCQARFRPLVPEAAQAAVAVMLADDDLSYDALRSAAPVEFICYERWLACVRPASGDGQAR